MPPYQQSRPVPRDTKLANISNPLPLLHIVARGLAMTFPIENRSHSANLLYLTKMDVKSSEC